MDGIVVGMKWHLEEKFEIYLMALGITLCPYLSLITFLFDDLREKNTKIYLKSS